MVDQSGAIREEEGRLKGTSSHRLINRPTAALRACGQRLVGEVDPRKHTALFVHSPSFSGVDAGAGGSPCCLAYKTIW